MRILVQKFGGTSLATAESRAQAMGHILDARQQGYSLVVVVSAMGRKGDPYATDTLIELLEARESADLRDLDLLLSCGEIISAVTLSSMLRAQGIDTIVLTGGQAGIVTSRQFSSARILNIDPTRILEELKQGRVVIVTGFQGITDQGEITTLGRGGSDTTATALGVELDAEIVHIFTDVEGIMTADPHIVADASRLKTVSYTEICNLAYQGAQVIHPRAVEIAMQKNIPIRVRSTMSKDEGTLVTSSSYAQFMEKRTNDRLVTGITQTTNITQLRINIDGTKAALKVFQTIADHHISVDFISVTPQGVAFTVSNLDVEKAIAHLQQQGFEPAVRRNCAKVAAVGAGIAGVPGVMAQIVEALEAHSIDILQSADSHTTIWCLVEEKDMITAVRALHSKFCV
ncbi:MAG: aspartate kinase [Bacilli bacterium]|nr:aspartate kinase [Bacilli bacterium]